MNEFNHSTSGTLRKRSMLPQRISANPALTMNLPMVDEHNVEAATLVGAQKTQTISRPPPTLSGMLRSNREQFQVQRSSKATLTASSRASSLVRSSDIDMLKTPSKPRNIKNAVKLPVVAESSKYRRSTSQRIDQTSNLSVTRLPSRVPSPRQASLRVPKPAFSAMQQHYSPKKKASPLAPKEPTATKIASEYNASEISNLHVELCQLHMMHRSAATVQSQWERSAKDFFQSQFNDLYGRHIELKEIAKQQRTWLDQLALVEWCQGVPSAHVAEKVEQVSRNIADIGYLLEPEGKYTRVLELFESWFTHARQVESMRVADTIATGRVLTFVEGIGDGWKAEAMVLERELTYCLRELKEFGEVRAVSSLGRSLSLHRTLVTSLLEELDVIQWIENETMVQEGRWVEQTIHKLSLKVSENM